MAASAWELYNSAIGKLGSANLDLDAGANIWKMSLHKTTSNASDLTLSIITSVNNQVNNGNGYVTGGASITNETWTSVASGTWRFDCSDVQWTASGGAITSIGFAVIAISAGAVLCKSKLTTTGFISIGNGGSLTVQINASGVFELT